ncbi:MAG TPA: phosphoenolpyruvate--protein phosphotransferase [Pyrinomonadaceae bacterium]|nr:phosphoenolpyruvate--protein phosphotransferase [Pyrinomonadaceae bacterium]
MTEQQELRFKGLGVSEGVVIGQVLRMHDATEHVYHWRIQPVDVEAECRRFRAALELAKQQVVGIKQQAEARLGKEHAYIFDAHLLLLEDAKLTGDVEKEIKEQQANAEWAVKVVGDRLLSLYSEIKDEYLRERGSDIDDVMQRLINALSGGEQQLRPLSEDAVIVSQDLLPSAVAELDLEHARALATDTGGWTSHTAILARGIGIPAVVGLRDFFRRAKTGDRIIVDSGRNEVILHPSNATIQDYQTRARSIRPQAPSDDHGKESPVTLDGVTITLRANVELPSEFEGVTRYGARGVGLFRSEFLLARRGIVGSEEQQQSAYEAVAKIAGDDGVIIRLFDLGAENVRDASHELEKNPALGLRAIRFGLLNEDIMRTQVRAILRAAKAGRLKIVLPMVTDISDVNRARAIIEEEAKGLEKKGVDFERVSVGAMIEVPSAVMMADSISEVVDFFELGTNDLVQYTLAVDRGSDEVADWFRTLHPAVLRSIDNSLKAARKTGIPAIVCGEMASTPAYAVLLLGLGATDLSMTPSAISRVRATVTAIDTRDARNIAEECLRCKTADEVENLVRERFGKLWYDLFPANALPAPRPTS